MSRKAFYAYPSEPLVIGAVVKAAVNYKPARSDLRITPWPAMNIQGIKIDRLIRDQIDKADFLIADLTNSNFNVYYEVGYAIGRGKPIAITVNSSIEGSHGKFLMTGIFDTVGQTRYENSTILREALEDYELRPLLGAYVKDKDHAKPLFMLDMTAKTDFRNWIANSIAYSHVGSRLFDPVETPRLSVAAAIGEISASSGVILPLVASNTIDSNRHNLRAAFLAGLSHGLKIETLIIQYEDEPAPLDFRDQISTVRGRRETEKEVEDYCQETLIRNQQIARASSDRRSLLEKIDIGISAAEREAPKLDKYFVRTAEFARALRSDGSIVVGRKGSGKSAIFYQVTAEKLQDKRNLIIELSPASHNLSEMREQLLQVLSIGIFDHTIAAFWQYVLYGELLIKARDLALPKAKYNFTLLEQISQIEQRFRLTDEMVSADFTSRLHIAIKSIIDTLDSHKDTKDLRPRLTNILFEREIPALRDAVSSLAGEYESITILFDNIDKGWPARRVEEHDVRMVRHLVDVLNKMQRELNKKDINLNYLIFIRSDVYERLVENTSDRGKYNQISVDWSDPIQLERLIRDRVSSNFSRGEGAKAWELVNPTMPDGTSAIQYLIESSLMRPRFLIDLCEKAISFAINRDHGNVEYEDVNAAVEQHSTYLVSDFGYEIRDVSGVSEDIFYAFIGQDQEITEEKVIEIISSVNTGREAQEVLGLLLWYGFLGIPDATGRPVYIYNRGYDIRRLEAERKRLGSSSNLFINPAFMRGL